MEVEMGINYVEYKIRRVTTYRVTRYAGTKDAGGSTEVTATLPTETMAYEIGCALCGAEHQKLGWPLGDERIQYPKLGLDSAEVTQSVTKEPTRNQQGTNNG